MCKTEVDILDVGKGNKRNSLSPSLGPAGNGAECLYSKFMFPVSIPVIT